MLSDSTEAPSFKVIVETRRRLGGLGGGVLIVYAGALVLNPSWLSQRMDGLPKELRQTTPSVRWVRQPLFPRGSTERSTSTPIPRTRPFGFASPAAHERRCAPS